MSLVFVSCELVTANVSSNHIPNASVPRHFYFGTSASSCFKEGTTWSSQESSEFIMGVHDVYSCQTLCLNSATCRHFTWFNEQAAPFDLACFLYDNPTTEFPCTNCISGPRTCTCSGSFSCQFTPDNFVGNVPNVENELLCQHYCVETDLCKFYSWFQEDPFPKLCLMFSSCDEKEFNCENCHSGPSNCENTDIMTSTSSPLTSTTTVNPLTSTTTTSPTTTTPRGCPNPPILQNYGDWYCPPALTPKTCYLECHPGYTSSNSTIILCEDGSWTEEPSCVAAVAIITGGLESPTTAEVYAEGFHQKLPDLPNKREYHTLQLVNSVLLLCGGFYSDTSTSCLTLTASQEWKPHSTTIKKKV